MIDCCFDIRLVYRTGVLVDTVKVSPKYQVVIPKEVRESMGIKPGQEVAVLRYRGRIELIPMSPVKEMRGFLRGLDSSVEREPDREI
jgi:AbrB family looped-hinge helix DNA binding protein